jgi:hypothetical protein
LKAIDVTHPTFRLPVPPAVESNDVEARIREELSGALVATAVLTQPVMNHD